MMSHAAIVSREYGLPAVVGTGYATKNIKTGQRLRVDGNTGIVTILD
jgi:pyruvate,water dikinase